MKRNSQQGVALVITLIMLSVITFMAVTFLVVSRHEAAGVDTLSQQSAAKFAADDALAQAQAAITAKMFATSNGLNFGLIVSTNYVQPFYTPNVFSLTNVSYYDSANAGALLQPAMMEQMLANQQILPRAPVFVTSNKNQTVPEFRFYLDLNRNGVYDTNGPVVERNPTDLFVTTNNYVGDPEWIGILNHPDQRHSSSNFYIGRYCYIAVPIGNSLDINYINNQNKVYSGAPVNGDGFIRNQGVGSWEINLPAFLNALNANMWGYSYQPTNAAGNVAGFGSSGLAFSDAASILQYRYSTNYLKLSSFANLYGAQPSLLFGNDFIDSYGRGPLMLFTSPLTFDGDATASAIAWSGDSSPNPFFTTQDLFNPSSLLNSFSRNLLSVGRNFRTVYGQSDNTTTNSYNRYTFYRLLSQMSFGSTPEPAPYPNSRKINLNYANANGASATAFQPWSPLQFFTNTANAMLAQNGYSFTITNIPIYPVNLYTPSVQRILQVALNIYDANTNKASAANGFLDYPTVMRPTFAHTGTNVFINGYVEDVPQSAGGPKPAYSFGTYYSLPDDITTISGLPTRMNNTISIYGIPWIIGARKGFPNFNEFSMQSVAQTSRKLEVIPGVRTNVQYIIGVSNVVGVEAWNSYASNYSRSVQLIGFDFVSMNISNELGWLATATNVLYRWNYPITGWPKSSQKTSFQIPVQTNIVFLPDYVYHPNSLPHFTTSTNFDSSVSLSSMPNFVLSTTNRLQFVLVDNLTGRVLDYVHFNLSGSNYMRNLTAELQGIDASGNAGGNGGVWLTNTSGGRPMAGIVNQLTISEGLQPPQGFSANGWIQDSLNGNSKSNAASNFRALMTSGAGPNTQAPYTPTRKVAIYYTWQANDPLVHYMLSDLTPMLPIQNNVQTNYYADVNAASNSLPNLGLINQRYLPWKNIGNTRGAAADNVNFANLAVKDPLITSSDAWQFPTNKYPNIGWLGRVHRGTPWQTVYLKSTTTDTTNWLTWTGNTNLAVVNIITNGVLTSVVVPDSQLTMPTNDWKILDLFTTAPNDNASRGQLSVNAMSVDEGSHSNLAGFAAWSAVLDGVFVLANSSNSTLVPTLIKPTDFYVNPTTGVATNTVEYFVSRINAYRSTNYAGVFTNVGQILAVPELTVASPYINTTAGTNQLSDAVYERIPQQIMSLLRVGTPRYVIFAYGQSLKPAPRSIVQGGPYFGMCTNYQITGEVATRTLVRFDNHPVPVPNIAVTNQMRAVVESFNVLGPGD